MATVIKHGYIKGRKGIERAKAHVRYIQYREGQDKEKDAPARPFFDKDRDQFLGLEVRNQIEEWDGRGVAIHKLMLSPGINGVNLQDYTSEVLDELSRQKGQDLDWKAVIHENTGHHHIHVVIMGKDKEGRDVRLNKNDYKEIKRAADRYLEREHYLERYLDREREAVINRKGYDRRGDREFQLLFLDKERLEKIEKEREEARAKIIPKDKWDKDEAVRNLPAKEKIYANDNVYSKFSTKEELLELNSYIKEAELRLKPELYDKMWTWIGVKNKAGDDFYEKEARGVKDFRDYEDFKKFEEDLRLALRYDSGEIPRHVRGEQRILEQQGRLSDYHFKYTDAMREKHLQEMIERDPEKADWARTELERAKVLSAKYWKDLNVDPDKLLGDCEKSYLPWFDKDREPGKERNHEELPVFSSNANKNDSDRTESETAAENKKDESTNDPDNIRVDLLGGRPQTRDDEERDMDRDFFGNEK